MLIYDKCKVFAVILGVRYKSEQVYFVWFVEQTEQVQRKVSIEK